MTEHELFKTFYADVFKTSYYMLHNYQDAEDITQDVFIKVFQQNYNEVESLKPWILSITLNMCRNYLKKKKRVILKENLFKFTNRMSKDNTSNDYERKETKSELEQILLNLPEKIKTVVILKYLQQLKYEEIAQLLSIPLGTVKSRCHKGLEQLNKKMVNRNEIYLFKEGVSK